MEFRRPGASGRSLSLSVSNHRGWRIAEIVALYGVAPCSPLACSILTGEYAPGAEPPADSRGAQEDAASNDRFHATDEVAF